MEGFVSLSDSITKIEEETLPYVLPKQFYRETLFYVGHVKMTWIYRARIFTWWIYLQKEIEITASNIGSVNRQID